MSGKKRQPEWLVSDEAARLLRLSKKSIYRLVDAGELPARRLPGGQLRFAKEDVEGVLRPSEPADGDE